ncbi:MAG: DEAD/DEAH box helicase [Bacteroidetes bacterium]|nr:DEAD/DEAH box helicase [Bacteroidota bacterium]
MSEFIIAIREYRNLGLVPWAYLVTYNDEGGFYSVDEAVTSLKVQSEPDAYTDAQKKIVELIEEYQEHKLVRIFSKKITTVADFFKKGDRDLFAGQIRPYIERRIVKIAEILAETDISTFFKEDKSGHIYPKGRIYIHPEKAETVFNFHRDDEGIRYYLSIRHDGHVIFLTGNKGTILVLDPCVLLLDNRMFRFADIDGKKLQPFFTREYVRIPKRTEVQYFRSFVLNSIKKYNVIAGGFKIVHAEPERSVFLTLQEDLSGEYALIMEFRYGNRNFFANSSQYVVVSLEEKNGHYTFTKYSRNKEWEAVKRERLTTLGLNEISRGIFKYLHEWEDKNEQKYSLVDWLCKNKALLEKEGFVFGQNLSEKIFLEKTELEVKLQQTPSAGKIRDWFDLYAIVHFGEFRIPFIRLKNNILTGDREFKLPNGEIAIIPEEWFTEYKNMMQYGQDNNGSIRVKRHHYHLFERQIIGHDSRILGEMKSGVRLKKKRSRLPSELNAELRPYQKDGFTWMSSLRSNSFGGCLADDMGLGKTVQMLAVLLKAVSEYKSGKEKEKIPVKQSGTGELQLSLFDAPAFSNTVLSKKPRGCPASLIVKPTSLIHNWENEILKFAPGLKVLKHTGQNRSKDTASFNRYDLILTSYGIVRNDIEMLRRYRFFYIVLDESQYIKNPGSRIYVSVTKLVSDHRMALTGTPVENSLTDLWSQMNFLNRGLLGNLKFFNDEFVIPIEKRRDTNKEEKLKALIHPFILRRAKEEVEKDLPSLSELTVFCDMTDDQNAVYEQERNGIRSALLELAGCKDRRSEMMFMVLRGLMKLRQIANHPVMTDNKYDSDSGKFEEITRKLDVIRSGRHKVLIYSSFVKHLRLYEKYFTENGWPYAMLTGKVVQQNRKKVIDGFRNDPGNRFFLISIKAGGTGLNLTEADYVFILDPWWNPAVEMQAVSRAHRIGQDKKVFVYRFISKDTVEEKIQHLQAWKNELAGTFINTNDPFAGVSTEKMMELFL